jgi:acetyl-CoA C-acetyltransferase
MAEDLTPVLVGAAQFSERRFEPPAAYEPLALMARTAERAAEDAGGGRRLLESVDDLAVVSIVSWQYKNLPRAVAEKLGLNPEREVITAVGGNTPQWLVNQFARRIREGKTRAALLTGAEAVYTRRRVARAGGTPPWSQGAEGTPVMVGDDRPGLSPLELAHGLNRPTSVYPLFENAWRARRGLNMADHRRHMGRLMSRLTAVAAHNPYAWFKEEKTPEEITTVSADNRMISFPYAKRMNAIMDVNQSASVILTSVSHARALGLPQDRWVYWWGGGEAAADPWFVSERPEFYTSPSLGLSAAGALAEAGLGVDEINFFDLYSCFPCAVEIACDMIGLGPDDPRPVTVTGGLPYAGGPGNNYTMHAIAAAMDLLRKKPEDKALITANGMYLSKHAAGVYSGRPKEPGPKRQTPAPSPAANSPLPPAQDAGGRGAIETYTVVHDREGAPETGIVLGRLSDGRRFLAQTPPERDLLEDLMRTEAIGRTGNVSRQDGRFRFDPA